MDDIFSSNSVFIEKDVSLNVDKMKVILNSGSSSGIHHLFFPFKNPS